MKKIIILIGGPGCGKGTCASALMNNRDFKYLETGALFRELPSETIIARQIACGNLVPDKEVCDLIKSKMGNSTDILFDGFPRTVSQAQWLVENYSDKFDITVLYINISDELMAHRIQKRFNDGSKRMDDCNNTIIERRISNFKTITIPAIEWLGHSDAVQFFDIDGAPDIDSVMHQIMAAL